MGLEKLQRLLSRSGISSDTCVVTHGYAAPLGFWLLKAHGHDDARILIGSRDQWAQAGQEWSTDVPGPPDGDHPPLTEQPPLLASREALEAAIGDPSAILLDVRAESEYSGERFWPSGATEDAGRAGRVPGSINVPIDSLRTADGSPKSREELGRVLENAALQGTRP